MTSSTSSTSSSSIAASKLRYIDASSSLSYDNSSYDTTCTRPLDECDRTASIDRTMHSDDDIDMIDVDDTHVSSSSRATSSRQHDKLVDSKAESSITITNPMPAFAHLARVQHCTSTTGGLSFNQPSLSADGAILITPLARTWAADRNTPCIRDACLPVTAAMGQEVRPPALVHEYVDDTLHAQLLAQLGAGKGVMDMWVKRESSSDIVLPRELACVAPILSIISSFERQVNPSYREWNMWLLLDTRPVHAGHTQRNAGWHYDGLNLGGKYAGSPLVSIYAWTNRLSTLFYNKEIKFPNDFTARTNASILAQMHVKDPSDIIIPPLSHIVKFDGATPHCGAVSPELVSDRLFLRVCFTPPGVWFDRLGNTPNPCMQGLYPSSFIWRTVSNPSVFLINPVCFANPEEFKNLWDVACLGHHAFATMYEGRRAHEHQLMAKLRSSCSHAFVQRVCELYARDVQDGMHVAEYRARLLRMKFEL